MMNRRTMILSSTATVALAGVRPLAAQSWTSQPVMLINPFSAGSAVDVVARLLADNLTARLGSPFLVENRTGASGVIGTEAVARAEADGTTFLVGSSGSMGINPSLLPDLPYDARSDFVAVSHVVSFPQAICVAPRLGITTLDDLAELARSRPGELRFGSSGEGSTSHLAMELVNAELGLDMIHVPYRGGSLAIQALISGEIDVATEGLPSLPGQIEAGEVIPIAVTSHDRSPNYPEVRAVSETIPGFDTAAWIILFARSGTDPQVVDTFARELQSSLEAPEVRARLDEIGAVIHGRTQADTVAFHQAELEKWARAVELAKR
ncbi:tripartite tricarboxylate transporter substrate binding protein [Phaeovulum sp. NW3]|uniref:Bug family tripartite tricarboxylate transporter substrate binding protein n=1 Tax=Phaeovulum sp. NW3 TaxID=2934933 RepID=UPI0020225F82|nr:tripartite tricarboxylate transporter substrate binding protein [Phaeovulum sp. NW3]MCL7466624.1 tripartite tricarboxylate transporter substrate binding protein [Phaeovulum sp. NW3]